VYEIGREETDFNKRARIDALKLSDEEWTNVELIIDLLKVTFMLVLYQCD
jgi:hypothetical protein